MKTRGIVATTLVGALVLGGGAALAASTGALDSTDPDPSPSASAASEVVAETGEPTAEPLPSASVPAAEEPAGDEDAYLVAVREALYRWPGTQIPDATDEQLLAAAEEACTQLADGATTDDLRVVDGETENTGGYFQDSAIIGEAALVYVCS